MHREAHTTRDVARDMLAARMPLLFPTHQIGGNAQLFTISSLPFLVDQIDVLEEELKRVHV